MTKENHLQPVFPRPPESKQEKHGQNNGCDLARVCIKPANDKACAYEGRTQISSWQSYPRNSAWHSCGSPFVGWEFENEKAALARCRAWEPKQDVRSSSIECILAHVSTPAKAWLIYSNVNKASIKTLETVPHEIRLSGAYSKLWLSIV